MYGTRHERDHMALASRFHIIRHLQISANLLQISVIQLHIPVNKVLIKYICK